MKSFVVCLFALAVALLCALVPVAFGFSPRKVPPRRRSLIVKAEEEGEESPGSSQSSSVDNEDEEGLSLSAFRKAREKKEPEPEFDGHALRDVILEKWGACYDVDFNRVDSFGMRKVYLNILPFRLGRRPFRHKTEYDYLCHLQAVVEILQEYRQLDYVLYQIAETNKRPRPGTSPLVAVPCRLDLTEEQVDTILGY